MTGIIKDSNKEIIKDTSRGMLRERKHISDSFYTKRGFNTKISIIDEQSFTKARVFLKVNVSKGMDGYINVFLHYDEKNVNRILSMNFTDNWKDHKESFVSELFDINCLDRFEFVFENHCNQAVEIVSIYMMCNDK